VEGELRALKSNLLELTGSVIRLRSQMREIEIQAESQIQSQQHLLEQRGDFDPLEFDRYTRFQELTRSLAEGINDVSTVQQSLLKNLDDADAALLAQARLSREVQQRLFSIRTVPFGSLSERSTASCARRPRSSTSARTSRSTARRSSSTARCWRSSSARSSICCATPSTTASSRASAPRGGQVETGEIALTVRQVGNEVVIELADDGGGINFDRVRERARSLGLLPGERRPRSAARRAPVRAGVLHGRQADADLGPGHRHGRRAKRDRRARRTRRGHGQQGQGNPVRADAARLRSPLRRRFSCAPARGYGRSLRRWSSRCSR
jgi:chemosensory pili system protein ChpA (sensor histidine kinase/response regulator)